MSMADPFLPEPDDHDDRGTIPSDDEIDIERDEVPIDEVGSDGVGTSEAGADEDPLRSADRGGDEGPDPIRLSGSRLGSEQLARDLDAGPADA